MPLRLKPALSGIELVDQEQRDRRGDVQAGRDAEEPGRAVRRQRHVVRLGQRGDLLHRRDAAGVAAVRLEDVEAAVLQVRHELPDGAVALAGRQRDRDLLLEPLEHLDVARHRRLLDEQHVVRLDARRRAGSASPAARRSGRRT